MKIRFITLFLIFALLVAGCQEFGGQDIIVEMEVTRIVVWTPTPDAVVADNSTGPVPVGSPDLTPEDQQTIVPTTEPTVAPTATQGPTATPDVFPTPIAGQIWIAEQDFQNGTMFWLQPINQIWVATTNEDGEQVWINRDDTFEEGRPESDPALEPPAEGLIQPIRGFGLIWRNDEELQSTVGWATSEELGYTTNYEYHWGGTVDDNGNYVTGPGYHLIETLNRNVYRFDEDTRTWEIIRQNE